ncbi:MAG: DNA polymerase III subunit chi [Magnetococcales bacterium]|nr:DNA polymerase III subunit chi [Magnetococcales bacterium]NGZ26579.1 DNA polymerase III subunit chi [Magnetococcales bacterium]
MARQNSGPPLVRFYQLAALPLHECIRRLAEKALERGLLVCVVTGGGEWETYLDDYLWQVPVQGFLPHGRCQDSQPHRQPVLLCQQPVDINGATVVMVANGILLEPHDPFDMIIDFAFVNNPQALQESRNRYLHYRKAGCTMEYWVQSETGWKKQG